MGVAIGAAAGRCGVTDSWPRLRRPTRAVATPTTASGDAGGLFVDDGCFAANATVRVSPWRVEKRCSGGNLNSNWSHCDGSHFGLASRSVEVVRRGPLGPEDDGGSGGQRGNAIA